jgi:hypothetical protein
LPKLLSVALALVLLSSVALPVSALQPIGPDAYELDDSPEDANELFFDETQQHSIHEPADTDWVRFVLEEGDRIVLRTGGNCDTYLSFFAPDGVTVLAEDDDSGGAPNAAIRFSAPETGVYFARVRLFGGSPAPCPAYQLMLTGLEALGPDTYEPDDGPTEARQLALDGNPQERSIHVPGDRDWVSIAIQGPIGIVVATGGQCDTFLTLYGTNGTTVLASDDDGGSGNNAAIVFTLQESGTYFVEVRHFDATEGTCDEYLFGGITQEPALPDQYEPDNNDAQSKPLPLDGTLQRRSFHTPNDDDWVSFPANAGDRIFLATEGDCDTFISVFGPDRRTLIREDDDAGGNLNAALLFTARETGTHYARLRAFGGAARACASYQLYGALVMRGGAATPGATAPAGPTATPRPGSPSPATPSPAGPTPSPAGPTPVPGEPLMPIPPTRTVR